MLKAQNSTFTHARAYTQTNAYIGALLYNQSTHTQYYQIEISSHVNPCFKLIGKLLHAARTSGHVNAFAVAA